MRAGPQPVEQLISAPRGSELRAVVDEFARVLEVLGRRLSDSVQEAERECAAVGRAFTTAKGRIDMIGGDPAAGGIMPEEAARIGAALDAAMVGLQYHDRLAQRVGHIHAGLRQLQQLLRDGTERSRGEWLHLLGDVERMHRLEQQWLGAAGIASNGSAELF